MNERICKLTYVCDASSCLSMVVLLVVFYWWCSRSFVDNSEFNVLSFVQLQLILLYLYVKCKNISRE